MKNLLMILLPFFISSGSVAQNKTKVKPKESTSLAYLKNYNGKYPGEVKLFSKPQFVNRVKSLIGTRYTTLKNYWDVESPIEITGDIFIAYACRPHNCDITNFMIIYDLKNDKMFVGIREEEKAKTYSENGTPIPARMDDWVKNNH